MIMKKLFFLLAMAMTSVTMSAQQSNVSISEDYVLDGESGQLIRVVNVSDLNSVDYNEVDTQPQTVVVRQETTSTQAVVETAASVIKTGMVVGALVHLMKHRHHHHHYPYYHAPVRHHHHHHPPMHHHHAPRPPKHHRR